MRSLNELKKAYPGKKIRIPEIFEINGEVLHSKEETALAMGVTSRTLTNWVNKEGLEQSKYSTKKVPLFNMDVVRDWYKVNKTDRNKPAEPNPDDPEDMAEKIKYDDNTITMWNATIAEGIEKARVKRLERIKQEDEKKIRRGEWISADIVDKTQQGFVTILLQTLTNKLTSLPPRLADKHRDEINVTLEGEFKDLIIQLKKALKKALVHVKE